MRQFFTSIVQSFKAALFPSKCFVCRTFFMGQDSYYQSRRLTSSVVDELDLNERFAQLLIPYICPACIGDFLAMESPMCPRCGIMFAARSDGDHLCSDCIEGRNKFSRARSTGVYEGTLLALIHQLKYHGRSELARPLGKLLFYTYTCHWEAGDIEWIIPVPLHQRKLRRRGFNQSYLLLAKWSDYFAVEKGGHRAETKPDLLQRVRWTAPQTGLGRQERQRNIKGAFSLNDKAQIRNRSVLLVDDVYTTGATVTECARVLKTGGVKRVDVLTLARTI